jgi:hypothetical protein
METPEIRTVHNEVKSLRTAFAEHLQRYAEHLQRYSDFVILTNRIGESRTGFDDSRGKQIDTLVKYANALSTVSEMHVKRTDAIAKYIDGLSTMLEGRLAEIENRLGIVTQIRLADHLLENQFPADAAPPDLKSLLALIVEQEDKSSHFVFPTLSAQP